jgi:hypothetical protein
MYIYIVFLDVLQVMCILEVVGSLQIIGSLHTQSMHLGVNYFP